MKPYSRRSFIAAAGSASLLAACSTNEYQRARQSEAPAIDAQVDATLNYLYTTYPATTAVRDASVAHLVMPYVRKAGFIVGGSYGRGAMRRDGRTLGYFSATSGSVGWQIGAQRYSHVLFFMNELALTEFLYSNGWTADAEADFAFVDAGGNISGAQINNSDVIAFVFGQQGLQIGARLQGTKYSRIDP